MDDNILKQVSGYDASKDAWIRLEKSFASKSGIEIIQVKDEL